MISENKVIFWSEIEDDFSQRFKKFHEEMNNSLHGWLNRRLVNEGKEPIKMHVPIGDCLPVVITPLMSEERFKAGPKRRKNEVD